MSKDIGIKKAFILAGGEGTRLRPITYEMPKVMLPIKGKPIIEWNIELAKKYGAKEIVLAVGHKWEQIQERYGDGSRIGLKLVYSVENEFLGTAGALKLAEKEFSNEKKFIMMNGDEVKDVKFDLVNKVHDKNNAMATIALTKVKDVSQFGVVRIDGEKIFAFVEKPSTREAPSKLINSGAYILSSEALALIPAGKMVSIEKEIFPQIAEQGRLFGIEFKGQWFPTDNFDRYEIAIKEWNGLTE